MAQSTSSSLPLPSSSSDKSSSNNNNKKKTKNIYESNAQLCMYLSLHFPMTKTSQQQGVIIPHTLSPTHALRFPQRVAQLLRDLEPRYTNGKALDVGCAVGGSSFELAKFFEHVEAFDNSESFIKYAKKMQRNEKIQYHLPTEGDLYDKVTAVHEEGVTGDVRNKIHFFVGDACKLPLYASSSSSSSCQKEEKDAGILADKFDGIILSNLLCRIPNPISCLDGLAALTNEGGVVVIVTPFSWFEHFTPKENWLGGYYDTTAATTTTPEGDPVKSANVLKRLMEERGFERIYLDQMPLVIREHQRKYQYIVSEATGWRKVK